MKENQPIEKVALKELLSQVEKFEEAGYRLSIVTCAKGGDGYDLTYSFDKDYKFESVRVNVTPEMEVPSISGIYWGAFIYENEIHDLFGISIRGINVDYKGNLYRTKVKHAFAKDTKNEVEACQSKQ